MSAGSSRGAKTDSKAAELVELPALPRHRSIAQIAKDIAVFGELVLSIVRRFCISTPPVQARGIGAVDGPYRGSRGGGPYVERVRSTCSGYPL